MEIRTETTNTDGKFDMRNKKNPLESGMWNVLCIENDIGLTISF